MTPFHHRWHTFTAAPLASTQALLARALQRARRRWATRQLVRHGVWPTLAEFATARPPHALPPDPVDLWYLYHLVATHWIQRVLEYGSGYSTAVLALALRRQQRPQAALVSYETDATWAASTRAGLSPLVEGLASIVVAPLVPARIHGVMGARWHPPPALLPDLIYVDGPGWGDHRPTVPGPYVLDILAMEARLQPGCRILVDGRLGSVQCLRTHLTRHWRVRKRWGWPLHTFLLIS